MKKVLISILIFIFLIITSFSVFANNEISLMSQDDYLALKNLLELKICDVTGISYTDFANSNQKAYLIFIDKDSTYHILVCGRTNHGFFDTQYRYFYCSSFDNWDLYCDPDYSFYFSYYKTDDNMNLNLVKSIGTSSSSKWSVSFNEQFGTTIFNYTNLILASNNISNYLSSTMNSSFRDRTFVEPPVSLMSDEEFVSSPFIDIDPRDFYADIINLGAGKSSIGIQKFNINVKHKEDDGSLTLVDSISLTTDNAYFNSEEKIFTIPRDTFKLMASTSEFGTGIYCTTISFGDQDKIQNTFHYNKDTDSISVVDQGSPEKPEDDSTNQIVDSIGSMSNNISSGLNEVNETNKSIWETLKEVASFLNPFSENFFVYKLIDLLIEGIKSLFVPADNFFSNYFTELKNWFSDRLGFLFYPFELIIDILNKILNIDFKNPAFSVPDINEPFTNSKLISAFSFNFNDLLKNESLKTVHDIYLILVDAVIIFSLVNLLHKKIEEVFKN